MNWKIVGTATLALAVAACGTERGERVSGGAAAGAATGAGIGALGGPVGALAGAAIGGGAGAATGAATSPSNLNLGEPPWSNPEVRTPIGDGGGDGRRARSSGGGGASGSSDVRQAQQALARAGYDPGPVDGLMGPQTAEALRDFQERQGIQPTGRLDGRTRQALNTGGAAGGGQSTAGQVREREATGGGAVGTGAGSAPAPGTGGGPSSVGGTGTAVSPGGTGSTGPGGTTGVGSGNQPGTGGTAGQR